MSQNLKEEDMAQLDWIKLHHEMRSMDESRKEKFLRKVGENPLVPIGCLATTCALCYGLWCFRTGNKVMSQYMMRTRVIAQGFTIVAMIVGVGMSASRAAKNAE